MSTPDPYSFLKTIIAKEFETELQVHEKEPRQPLVITLSRDYGACGETIAQKLSAVLGIPVYDQEILERVAQKAKVDRFKLELHDEKVSAGVSSFLYSLLTGTAGELETYRRCLYEVILELARQDCLLIGRGTHLILSGRKVFRLRVVGSRLVCARRVAEEFGISLLEAERKVYEINNKRHKSIQSLYGDSFEHASLEFAKNFDLILNTDRLSADNAIPVLLLAIQQIGFDLHTHMLEIE